MSAINPNPVPGIPARIAWAGIVDKIEPNYQGNFERAYAGSKYTSRLDNLYIRDAANQLVHKGGDCTIHNTSADDKRRRRMTSADRLSSSAGTISARIPWATATAHFRLTRACG